MNQTENELREKLLKYFANAMFGKKLDDLNELGKHAVSNQADGMQEIINLHRQQGVKLPQKKVIPSDSRYANDPFGYTKDRGYNQALDDVIALNKDGEKDVK